MKRRTAIRNVLIFSVGAVLLPRCAQDEGKATVVLKNIPVTGSQEKMLTELAEFILPTTTTPGGIKLASQQYILMMVDDCFTKEEQGKYVKGMQAFDDFSKKKVQSPFIAANTEKRTELLKAIEAKENVPEEILSFYNASKRLTIQSFTGSKFYLTEVRKYDMVPGRFHGCFPVNAKS